MGNEIRWRRPSVGAQDPPRENGDAYVVGLKTHIEAAADDATVLCDCHCEPMYYFPVSLISTSDFVMCWVSECGRCYGRSLGYFRLRPAKPTLSRVDEASRRITRCPNQNCPTSNSMAVTRCRNASGGEEEIRWHCFECGTELPFHNFGTLWKWLLRSFGPPAHHGSQSGTDGDEKKNTLNLGVRR
jgi:hypothetical protein